jgi:hypothetical protein
MAAASDFSFLVVPHTHWDREWYVPFEVFRLRLGPVVDVMLETLEFPGGSKYCHDGASLSPSSTPPPGVQGSDHCTWRGPRKSPD